MLRNLTQIPRSTFRTLVERKKDEERKERAWLDRWARIDRQIRRIGQTGGSAFLFLPFWFTVERTTNKWPATCTRATPTRIGKRMLRSECRFRESFVNRALATRFWGRGDTLIDHHLLSSLYPLFFSRFFSLSLSAPRFRLSIPFFPVQSIGRVSRLKRHLLISFLSSPFLSRIFLLEYTYVHTCVCKRTRCSNWKLIFESIGER